MLQNETKAYMLKRAQEMSDEEFRRNFLEVNVFFKTLDYDMTMETQAETVL